MPFNNWLSDNSGALLAASAGLLGGRTGSEQASMGLQGFGGAMAANKSKNKTLEFLKQMNPELAQAVEAGALSPLDAYKTHVEAQKPKTPNYMSAGGSIFNEDTGEWLSPPAGAGNDAEYGLAPVWGKNAQGETVLGQLSKNGTFQQTQMPDGFTPTPGISNIDTGTGTLTVNSRTGVPMAETPKDLAGVARERTVGEGQGAASMAIPGAKVAANQIATQVKELKNDPYLPSMLGPTNSKLPNVSSDAARVQGKIEQLKGGAFLQARQILKGGGAITDFEGQKAEQAYTRMSQAQTVEDFNAALDDFNTHVQNGVRLLQEQAGQPQAQGKRLRFNPATGELE